MVILYFPVTVFWVYSSWPEAQMERAMSVDYPTTQRLLAPELVLKS